MAPVLELRGITKRFPGVLANDHIDLILEEGQVHALLGENGAGKTTLMNILYGLYQPTEGEIYVRGKKVEIHSPSDAIASGIGMVHQHFMLVPVFTVTENVMLGEETTRAGGVLDRKATAKRIQDISDQYRLEVDPWAMVGELPVGVQQRVEIIKLLYRNADILIFDEPTAVLTPQEADDLFRIMETLTQQGKSIIFITHKLREVLDAADVITVIRRGKVVGATTPAEADQNSLAAMMVGRDVQLELEKEPPKMGDLVLEVKDLIITDVNNLVAVDQISFEVYAGEVLGIAGVQGNGQTELVEALTGLMPVKAGKVHINGRDVTDASPRVITETGTAHVPEDRQRDGLVLSFPVMDNLILNSYYIAPNAQGLRMEWSGVQERADELIKQYDIRTPSALTNAGALSGGNQQKVIVARELSRQIKLLIASQPTRGLDIGSIEYIHGQILQRRNQGVGVLLVSTELDEVLQLSDRIAVMYRGKIVAVVPAEEATKGYIGLLMAGIPPEQAKQRAEETGEHSDKGGILG
jgi:simple sugar transport system ATP-binding protein